MTLALRSAYYAAWLVWGWWWMLVPVQAQSPDDERGRAHFEAGESYFEEERYEDAAREFREAFELSGRPEMLINQARSLDRAGKPEEAVAALELLLERYPRSAYRGEAESHLESLRAQLASRELPETEAAVPEPVVEQEPPLGAAPGDEGEKAVRWWPPRWPTLLVAGSSLALGVAALGTGVAAHGLYGDLEQRCPGGTCSPEDEDDRTRGQRLGRASTGLTFGAVAGLGAAAVLWWLDLEHAREQARVELSFNDTTRSARLVVEF